MLSVYLNKRRSLFFLPFACIAITIQAQQIHVGPNMQVSPWDGEHTYDEVRIAADPYDSRNLVACALPQHNDVAAFVSQDNGAHWKQTLYLPNAGDVECEFGNHGDVYLVAIVEPAPGDVNFHLGVYWSCDHGQTWEKHQTLPFIDRPAITVDRSNTKSRDTLYIVGQTAIALDLDPHTQSSPSLAVVYRSRDTGHTFDQMLSLHYESALKSGPLAWISSHPAILSDGTVVYATSLCNPESASSCYKNLFVYASQPGKPLQLVSTVPLSPAASGAMPVELAAAREGPFRDRLYAVYCGAVEQGGQRPYFINSADRGKTWSAPLAIGPPRGPCLQPMVAVNKDGVVGMSWYAGKTSRKHWNIASSSGFQFIKDLDVRCDVDERFAASLDGGKTALPSVVVNPIEHPAPIKFVPRLVFDNNLLDSEGFRLMIGYSTGGNGDTEGLTAAADGSFYPDWVDFRDGVGMVQTAKIEVLPTGSAENHLNAQSATVSPRDDNPCRASRAPQQSPTRIPRPKSFPANDITAAYRANILNSSYDKKSNTYTADVQLEGPAQQLAHGVYLQLTHGKWPVDTVFLNADNGLQGEGARWLFTALRPEDAASEQHVKSSVHQIKVHMPPLQLNSDAVFYLRVLDLQSSSQIGTTKKLRAPGKRLMLLLAVSFRNRLPELHSHQIGSAYPHFSSNPDCTHRSEQRGGNRV